MDYFDYNTDDVGLVIFYTLRYLKSSLKSKYKSRKFCLIISIDEGIDNVRFHTYKNDDDLWISIDLEAFDQPILYEIF